MKFIKKKKILAFTIICKAVVLNFNATCSTVKVYHIIILAPKTNESIKQVSRKMAAGAPQHGGTETVLRTQTHLYRRTLTLEKSMEKNISRESVFFGEVY